ncbi:MAG: hypothetical protein HOP29_14925, partial [Phycisphaerales bacterium]|nr:hypothetical protein [Phycisphaerales bacterium]
MRRVAVGVVVVAVIVLLGFAWYLRPRQTAYYTDADSIMAAVEEAPIRDILWQPAQPVGDLINTSQDDYEPRMSSDGQTLYFVRGKAGGGGADIYWATRTPEGWTEPAALSAVNSEHDDLGPEPSRDGDAIYFYSDRPGGAGGYDVWRSQRDGDGWGAPVNLGPGVNSPFNDYGPALTPDGATLYFASNRPNGNDERPLDPSAWSATIREEHVHRDYDLYVAPISERGHGRAAPVAALNSRHNEGAAAVSAFGDFLYFASDRPGGLGGYDVYRSRQVRGLFGPPENLGGAINGAANEL